MNLSIVAALLLAPQLVADEEVRLVSHGTGSEPVVWFLDGETVATTTDGTAESINLTAGRHELWATTTFDGGWQALARIEPGGDGINFVPAWTAAHEPELPAKSAVPSWIIPASLAVLGAGLLFAPSSKNP